MSEDTVFCPGLMVACGPSPFLYGEAPGLLPEILSESTEDPDRGRKLGHYSGLPSPRVYPLVESRRVSLEAHLREEDQGTYPRLGPGGSLPLPCPPPELTVAHGYPGVNLEEG